ncbi:MAG: LysM peptidoglycan-binding domain-containing protein [Patescibacteria group bacterium]|nr:LysM peptidoglycan-binding domain-containing protein [Patescibacteria group bacterium]
MNTFKPLFIIAALGVAFVVVYNALSRAPDSDRTPPHVEGLATPLTDAPLVQMPGASSTSSPFGASTAAAPESWPQAPHASAPPYPASAAARSEASPYPSSAADPPGYGSPAAAVPPGAGYRPPVATDPPGRPYDASAAGGRDSLAPSFPGTSVYATDPPQSSGPSDPRGPASPPGSADPPGWAGGFPLSNSPPRGDADRAAADAPAWPASSAPAAEAPRYSEPARPADHSRPAESLESPREEVLPRQEYHEAEQSFQRLMDQISRELEAGKLAEAHSALSQFYRKPGLDPQHARQVVQLLDQLAGTVIYSRHSLLEPPYVVRPGDTLQSIADQYSVPPELIANINGMRDPRGVQPGQELKVVRGPFHAVVNLADYEMTLMLGSLYAGRFPISIGRDQSNLEGSYIVADKGIAPTYHGPDGTTYDERDQRNPLGSLWLGLGDRVGQAGRIGIHGTNDPRSVGRDAERGNIGLEQRDIQDVYGILSVGSRVVIQR